MKVLCLAFLLAVPSLACAGAALSHVPKGDWGGEHASLSVGDADASIEFDCAHGSIDVPIALDSQQRFDAAGRYAREHGGPIRPGEDQTGVPARYKGTCDGKKLTFSVTLDGGDTIGPFELTLDGRAHVVKCR